jgi:hypothetical protein
MPRNSLPLLLAAGLILGCSEPTTTTSTQTATPGSTPSLASASHGPVIHRVNIGGPDNCTSWGGAPGCDANFSLSARQYADGYVEGMWVDRFSQNFGGGGAKGQVTCLVVDGNFAWIGGVVPSYGEPAIMRARDRGQSMTEPTDRWAIYYNPSDWGLSENCLDEEFFFYADVPEGQVTIR